MRDRRRYLHWLFEAKKRFGLSVLNYMITSNHVHLLIKDTGPNVIADSMQLIAGRTAQEYNQRKDRQGVGNPKPGRTRVSLGSRGIFTPEEGVVPA
jgi:REP element-mobilizing transposase RayT